MDRILLLNNGRFPEYFKNIEITLPMGISKIAYAEEKIIKAINNYNPKLDVKKIEYLDINKQFSYYKESKSNGVLIEEFDIKEFEKSKYINNGCYIYNDGKRCICRRILLYVFISGFKENTRTGFVSQTVFPTMLEHAAEFMQSPSYSISNHKFCFINILSKSLKSTMICRHLAGLCAIGIDYVEVFDNESFKPLEIPFELKKFLKKYSSKFDEYFDVLSNQYEDNNYNIDFEKKKIKWKTQDMISKLTTKSEKVDFNGSAEKFYWIEILPISIFAWNQGYKIDYLEYENFITTYKTKFPSTSDKFRRCEILLKYAKKYFN